MTDHLYGGRYSDAGSPFPDRYPATCFDTGNSGGKKNLPVVILHRLFFPAPVPVNIPGSGSVKA
jgi:hypothetical protein